MSSFKSPICLDPFFHRPCPRILQGAQNKSYSGISGSGPTFSRLKLWNGAFFCAALHAVFWALQSLIEREFPALFGPAFSLVSGAVAVSALAFSFAMAAMVVFVTFPTGRSALAFIFLAFFPLFPCPFPFPFPFPFLPPF